MINSLSKSLWINLFYYKYLKNTLILFIVIYCQINKILKLNGSNETTKPIKNIKY